MPSNFKRMVRARMAETGESWQAAARNVRARAKTGPVIAFTSDDEEVNALIKERGHLTVLKSGSPTTGRRLSPPVVVDARYGYHDQEALERWVRESVLTRLPPDAEGTRRPLVVVWTR